MRFILALTFLMANIAFCPADDAPAESSDMKVLFNGYTFAIGGA